MNFNWLYRLWATLRLAYHTCLKKISKKQITYAKVRQIMLKHTYAANVRVADNHYTVTSAEIMKWLVKISPLKYRTYQSEIFDCDDYSFSFMGLMRFIIPNFAVGIVWTKTHALNFFIDEDGKLWFIEPQTNAVFEPIGNEYIQLMVI